MSPRRSGARRTTGRATKAGRPAFVDAMVATALLDVQDGRPAAAADRLRGIAAADAVPRQAATIARVLIQAGATVLALPWLDRALAEAPGDATLMADKARALAKLGRGAEALEACQSAALARCMDAGLYLLFGDLLRGARHEEAAIAAYDTALRLRPAFPEALKAGGSLLAERGHPEAALRFLGEALRLAPDDREALLARTALLQDLGRFAEALADYDAALGRLPGQADLLANRGVALQNLGRLTEARASFAAALAADPSLAPAWLNLGNVLVWFGEAEEAIAAFDRALGLRPAYPEALCGRGVALKVTGRFAEAAHDFDAALAVQPGFPHARANRGELRLLLGDLQGGWADYEDRFRSGRQTRPVLGQPVPAWDGVPREGARLAVLADQGNGDMIHFARYLPLLAARGMAVTFLCPARLHRLLAPVARAARVVDLIAAEEPFDAQIALSSLPHAFATGLATIPACDRYLTAEPELVRHWAGRIGGHGLRIGLCWRGSQNWQADPRRSLPLAALAPLARVPGARLFSLQLPDDTGSEDDTLAALGIDPLGAELDRGPDAFVDTAAAMATLDLVVTCDTSLAHLAGALGRPVFVLLQAAPEWRWMLNRSDSPWYPSMRLFRQRRAGAWDEPVDAVVEAVRTLTGGAA